MNAYIAYNKRSCTTGRALFEYLKDNQIGGYNWRHTTNVPRRECELFLRWGNSLSETPNGVSEINTRGAVNNASNKRTMIEILNDTAGVTLPPLHLLPNDTPMDGLHHFFRDVNDHIQYRTTARGNDKYYLDVVDKTHEYRIHVFNSRTVGVYEKVPHEGTDGFIRKDNNCDFVRRDMANDVYKTQLRGARPMAVAAVNALGLVHGGVDIIKDADGNWYILEVNSSPALNEPNIERWCTEFSNYITNLADNTAEREQQAIRERAALAEAVRSEERALVQQDLTREINRLARQQGFSVESLSLMELI